jgi:hypothetical protein
LDNLSIAICLSIGCAVPWVLALYTSRGERLLLWDMLLATAGAALCALAFWWASPTVRLVVLVVAGPFCAALMIFAGDAGRRALRSLAGRRSGPGVRGARETISENRE